MLQGNVDAIGTYYDLQSSGLDLQKTIEKVDLDQEEIERGKSFSESEAETSFSRGGSFSSSSFRKRGASVTSKSSVTEVSSFPHFTKSDLFMLYYISKLINALTLKVKLLNLFHSERGN